MGIGLKGGGGGGSLGNNITRVIMCPTQLLVLKMRPREACKAYGPLKGLQCKIGAYRRLQGQKAPKAVLQKAFKKTFDWSLSGCLNVLKSLRKSFKRKLKAWPQGPSPVPCKAPEGPRLAPYKDLNSL